MKAIILRKLVEKAKNRGKREKEKPGNTAHTIFKITKDRDSAGGHGFASVYAFQQLKRGL